MILYKMKMLLSFVLIIIIYIDSSYSFIMPKVQFKSSSSSSSSYKLINNNDKKINVRKNLELYGIPKLFRWLVDIYPLVLESVGEGLQSGQAMAVDNFYLDMNGIIHTCTHSNNDKLVVFNEKEMFHRIFAYTDRLYKLVKPCKLMYLAVDGVAPRAKMNQQRSRRFRSSKEREILMAETVAKEGKLPDEESFDSNCITPGTDFMFRLGIAFQRWIKYKMETDPFWQTGAEVIFSGPDVPGEGEHKIMDMIRNIKDSDPNYVPGKLRHCMYGLDADLIMLSLVSHEPFFVLLREKINRRKQNKNVMTYTPEDFELLEISILRKMLQQHFRKTAKDIDEMHARATISMLPQNNEDAKNNENAIPSKFTLERLIDDFVFMCFFVGNDFLPCIPHLDIADGSLNLMMNIYLDIMSKMGGFMTNKDKLHLPRIELFLQEVARREPLYFQQRSTDEKDPLYAEESYRDHYYKMKFDIEPGDETSIKKIVKEYLQGLAWVLTYYHNGCRSWIWYYPYLYAPLASDLVNLANYDLIFEEGTPFTPLLQLLSVLPPQSGGFLPPAYEELMTTANSPLLNYYPKNFEVDANGKKNSWECIVKIPFIDEKILLDTVSTIKHDVVLTESERRRNILGYEHRFSSPNANTDPNPKRSASNEKWGSAFDDRPSQQQFKNNYDKPQRSKGTKRW